MFRYLSLMLLLIPSVVVSQEPTPVDEIVAIVAPDAEVTGTGTRKDPFLFSPGSLCVLELTGNVKGLRWNLDDAPAKSFYRGNLVVFPQVGGDEFIIAAQWEGGASRNYWFTIKGPNGPPAPVEDCITRRVKTSLAGQPKDAATFGVVCEELAKALDAGTIVKQSNFESSMKAALTSVSWQVGKYADLSKLTSELFDRGDKDWTLTAEDKATFSKHLRTIADACKGIK